MDYKELISDLRKEAEWYGMTEGGHAILLERAIMAITELLNQTEKAERERDAAISELESYMAYGGKDGCLYCKNAQCYQRGGTKPCLPKWRGIKEE